RREREDRACGVQAMHLPGNARPRGPIPRRRVLCPRRTVTRVKPKTCPCHSGAPYRSCCGPRHDRSRPADTPDALMRSRYAAFALGVGEYLVDTLASDHEDRAAPRASLVRELSRVKDSQRFMGLEIRDAKTEGDRGEVTFHARIF